MRILAIISADLQREKEVLENDLEMILNDNSISLRDKIDTIKDNLRSISEVMNMIGLWNNYLTNVENANKANEINNK